MICTLLPAEAALAQAGGGQHTLMLPPQAGGRKTVPDDDKLEALARKLVQSPGEFLAHGSDAANKSLIAQIRIEGIKALRRFKSEQNLAIIRAWLNDSSLAQDATARPENLLPLPAKLGPSAILPSEIWFVPEVHFQQPLTRAMSMADAQLHTACNIDVIHFLNQKKTDGFVEALVSVRRDLAGLPFIMGDACRMTQERSQAFVKVRERLNLMRLPEFPPRRMENGRRVVYRNGDLVPASIFDRDDDDDVPHIEYSSAPIEYISAWSPACCKC
jgi:hypothetical protein